MWLENNLFAIRKTVIKGHCYQISPEIVRDMVPARGMNDWENLALAWGGNRPEPRQTAIERLEEIAARTGWRVQPQNSPHDLITLLAI